MVAINFSARFAEDVENGRKNQTIRECKCKPFFCIDKIKGITTLKVKTHLDVETSDLDGKFCKYRKLKPGTALQLYTQQRVKKVFKCLWCNEEVEPHVADDHGNFVHPHIGGYGGIVQVSGCRKLRDTVVTETKDCEIRKHPQKHEGGNLFQIRFPAPEYLEIEEGITHKTFECVRHWVPHGLLESFARLDGFKNAWEMFQWFDNHYDLIYLVT